MPETFTKLSTHITESSLWTLETAETCKVWITLLAMSDAGGVVRSSVPGLAQRAVVSIDHVESALKCFLSPDKYSRTPDNEGRRLEIVEGGWVVLNHGIYRGKREIDDRRESDRERKRKQRSAKNVTDRDMTGQSVTSGNVRRRPPPSAHTEAEAEAEAEAKTDTHRRAKAARASDAEMQIASEVIGRINAHLKDMVPASRGFTETKANVSQVLLRIRDGVGLSELLRAVDACAEDAAKNPASLRYFTPITPFRAANWPTTQGKVNAMGRAKASSVAVHGYMKEKGVM